LTAIAGSIALLVIGLGVYQRFRTSSPRALSSIALPQPPSLVRVTDPAVKKRIAECRAAVTQSPRSAAVWGRLGLAFFAHDFPDEAKVCIGAAEQLDPRDAHWPYFAGLLRAEKDPDGATRQLQHAAELCADQPDTPRLQLAELLLTHGQTEKAAQQFQLILQRNPKNARAHLGLGRLALMQGELSESQTHLEFSVRDRHTQKAAHLLLAQVQERYGNKAAAENEYRQGASAPDDLAWPDPYYDDVYKLQTGLRTFLIQANLLLEQRRLDACIALCRQLLHDYPDSDMLWLTLGKAFVQKRDFPAAQQALQKVLQLTPDSVQAYFQLGFAAYLGKDYPAAVTWYRKATELKPDFTFAYHDLGHCLLLQGNRAAAIEAFRAALRCQPDLAGVHKTLADLLSNDGQYGEAFTHARVALQLNPTDAAAKKLLQRLLKRISFPAGF
jgi:tetratricopeptide (TPR) repeat protein